MDLHPNFVWLAVIAAVVAITLILSLTIRDRDESNIVKLMEKFVEWRKHAYDTKLKIVNSTQQHELARAEKIRELKAFNDHLEIK